MRETAKRAGLNVLIWVLYRLGWPITRHTMALNRQRATEHMTGPKPNRGLIGSGALGSHAQHGLFDEQALCGLATFSVTGGEYPDDIQCRRCRKILLTAYRKSLAQQG